MSIVVAVNKGGRIVMAADSMSCFGSERAPQENSRTAKIYRFGEVIFSVTGWAVYDDIITHMLGDEDPPDLDDNRSIFSFFLHLWKQLHESYPFVNDQSQDKDTPFGDLDSSFLIAARTGIFKVSSDLGVSPFQQYYAIGSGGEYGLGALYNLYASDLDAPAVARGAVETAIQFDVHCGGEVDVIEVE